MVEFWGRFSRLATYLRISRAGVPRLSTSAVALAFGNECSRSHHGSQGPRSRQPPKRPRVSTHRAHPLHCGRRTLCRKCSIAGTKAAGSFRRLRAPRAPRRTPAPLRAEAGRSGLFEASVRTPCDQGGPRPQGGRLLERCEGANSTHSANAAYYRTEGRSRSRLPRSK